MISLRERHENDHVPWYIRRSLGLLDKVVAAGTKSLGFQLSPRPQYFGPDSCRWFEMLQTLSEEIRLCYREAEHCSCQAKIALTETSRNDYLRQEQSWLKLARSYELQQRLTAFINGNRNHKNDGDRGMGHVNADSVAARTAWVDLPGRSSADNNPRHLQNQLIAIVDDEPWARGGLSTLIESVGYKAAAFASAEDYLASDERDKTAFLILDIHLPGLSGPDLQAHLIADGYCPPTVFVTGKLEESVRNRVIAAGALGYLSKPCRDNVLLDCIAKALGAMQ
jgi:CheY-like chemotaxis protein